MKFITLLLFSFSLALLPLSNAHALPIDATKDSYVRSGTPGDNFGSDALSQIKWQGTTAFNRKSYLGFDLSGLPALPIASASLSLNFVESGAGILTSPIDFEFELFGLTEQTLDGWGENTITWSNAPANLGNNAINSAQATSLGTFSLLGKGIGEFVFSNQALVDFLNEDTNDIATFILRRNTDQPGNQNYVHAIATRENTQTPGASLSIQPVPEPSTILLLGGGLIGIGFFARRRKG